MGGIRRKDFQDIMWVFDMCQYFFWDFLSLHQWPRSPEEERLFRTALSAMHLLYSNPNWNVYRLPHVPATAANPTPYEERGWCFFETAVSSTGARIVGSVTNGEKTGS